MTEQQKDFVHMYLKHRDKIIAHNIVYGDTGNYDAAESAANRLLRIPEIADTIRSIQDNIRHEVEEEFKAKYREELLSIYDKRMLLKRIATGEMYVEQKYKGKNCTQCSQYISPTINQMLAAIREDNKLAGHHPFKQNGKWVIPALQTEQEDETSPLQGPPGQAIRTGDLGVDSRNSNTPEKENNLAERLNEANEKDINNRIKGQQIETTPLLFLGGDIGASASGGDKRQSGWSTREERETQDENPEKDNIGQHPEETNTDNQPLTNSPETFVNPSGNIISQEKLRELLYPQKPKLSYMKNNP